MSVIYLIPTAVAKYIDRHGLYRSQRYHGELSSSIPSSNASSASFSTPDPRADEAEAEVGDDGAEDSEYVSDAQLDELLKNDDAPVTSEGSRTSNESSSSQ